jgi:orotate phosphoribosyltransferase
MEKKELAERITAVSYLTGQFRLRSGKVSPFYWDKYRFESDPTLLSAIVDELQKLLPPAFDRLAGLELGGIPLATVLSLKTSKPCLFVRKTPKTYGTCSLVEGGFQPDDRVVVVEDVVATAGQMCRVVKQMRGLGLVVEHVVCVVSREPGGYQGLQSVGCSLATVFTMNELDGLTHEST